MTLALEPCTLETHRARTTIDPDFDYRWLCAQMENPVYRAKRSAWFERELRANLGDELYEVASKFSSQLPESDFDIDDL